MSVDRKVLKAAGITERHWRLISEAIRPEIPREKIAEIWLYGSRANGTHRSYSDLDLLFCPNFPMSDSDKTMARIRDRMEESRIPFKIDLVLESEIDPDHKRSIQKKKRLLATIKR